MITTNIFTLSGQVLLDDAGVNSKLNQLDTHASSVGKSVGSSFANMKLAFGAVGLLAANYLKGAVESAMTAQKANSNVETTIKSTGMAAGMTAKQVLDMASGFSKVSTFGGSAIKTGDAMLLTFTNIGKDVLPGATQAMLDMATKMKTDPVQSAVLLGKALNDPEKGLSALTRVGVTFTEQQKKQITAMQKAGDTAGAQKLILAELNKEFGGQALAATKTYEGQLIMMSKSMAGIKTSIGMAVLPYLQKMAEGLQKIITPIAEFMQKNSALSAVILSLTAVFGLLIGGVGLVQKVMMIMGPVVGGLGTAFTALTLPIAAVIAGIALMGLAYTTNFLGIKTTVDGFINGVWKQLSDVFKEVKEWVVANLPAIQEKFQVVFDAVKVVAQSVFDYFSVILLPVFVKIYDWVVANLPTIKATFKEVFDNVVAVATVLWDYFQVNLLPIIMRLVDTVKENLPAIQRIFETVFSIIGNVLNIAWDVIKKVWDIMVSLYDFVSPTFPTLGAIIKTAFDIIISAVEGAIAIFVSLIGWVTKAVDAITSWNNKKMDSKSAKVTTTYDDVGNPVEKNASGTNFFKGGLTHVNELGGEIMNLPRGTQIIPHDVSMEMARNGNGSSKGITQNITINSPTALSPSEVARQSRRSLQELALSF